VFEDDAQGTTHLLRRGRKEAASGAVQAVDVRAIAEDVTASWYSDRSGLNPASGTTTPAYPKSGGYSWLKSPRYSGKVYEVGALARMTVNGDYSRGVSVMDRHAARAQEALKIAQAIDGWLNDLVPNGPMFDGASMPASASGIGLTEAPRGALGHWLSVADSKISRYQIVTPTCWNASPRDARSAPGALEQALVGTPVVDTAQPIEVLRVIHSFDPCLSCAVHVSRPGQRTPVTVVAAGA
jgi:hydrogenase large subunit